MEHRPSFIISKFAAENYKRDNDRTELNLSEMSRFTGCTISSLWFYFNERRRWPVESWLKVLLFLGAAEIKNDQIIISIPNKSIFKNFLKNDTK